MDINTIKASYILLCHGHHNPLAAVEEIYKNTETILVVNFEPVSRPEKKEEEKKYAVSTGGKKIFDHSTIKTVAAKHSYSLHDGSYDGYTAGFVMPAKEKNCCYAGDSTFTREIQLSGAEFRTDFAFLPKSDNFTMSISGAGKGTYFVKTDTMTGMHYEPFPYIKTDRKEAKNVAANAKKDFKLMEIGGTLTL